MNVQLQTLKSDMQVELDAIERIFQSLPAMGADLADVKEAIIVGYYLHNLYNAFESIFKLVATAFENHIPDPTQWHALMLDRMGRDIENVRPRLLSDAAIDSLDELRRFRHLFRHLYRYDLRPDGVQIALTKAHRLQSVYQTDIETFMHFIANL
jgi:hypothetical protein